MLSFTPAGSELAAHGEALGIRDNRQPPVGSATQDLSLARLVRRIQDGHHTFRSLQKPPAGAPGSTPTAAAAAEGSAAAAAAAASSVESEGPLLTAAEASFLVTRLREAERALGAAQAEGGALRREVARREEGFCEEREAAWARAEGLRAELAAQEALLGAAREQGACLKGQAVRARRDVEACRSAALRERELAAGAVEELQVQVAGLHGVAVCVFFVVLSKRGDASPPPPCCWCDLLYFFCFCLQEANEAVTLQLNESRASVAHLEEALRALQVSTGDLERRYRHVCCTTCGHTLHTSHTTHIFVSFFFSPPQETDTWKTRDAERQQSYDALLQAHTAATAEHQLLRVAHEEVKAVVHMLRRDAADATQRVAAAAQAQAEAEEARAEDRAELRRLRARLAEADAAQAAAQRERDAAARVKEEAAQAGALVKRLTAELLECSDLVRQKAEEADDAVAGRARAEQRSDALQTELLRRAAVVVAASPPPPPRTPEQLLRSGREARRQDAAESARPLLHDASACVQLVRRTAVASTPTPAASAAYFACPTPLASPTRFVDSSAVASPTPPPPRSSTADDSLEGALALLGPSASECVVPSPVSLAAAAAATPKAVGSDSAAAASPGFDLTTPSPPRKGPPPLRIGPFVGVALQGAGSNVVAAVKVGSAAYRVGIRVADALVSVAGQPVAGPAAARRALSAHCVGDVVAAAVVGADGRPRPTADLTLGKQPSHSWCPNADLVV